MQGLFGDYEEIRKSGLFNAEYYLAEYPDVVERNLDPLVHYLEEGAQQGRNPSPEFDSAFYREQCRQKGEEPSNPLLHYIRIGLARGFGPRPGDPPADKPPPVTASQRSRARNQAGRQPILVAIESLGVIGMPDGSSRFSVGGWALAAAPVSEITASMNGRIVGTATYGLGRPDVARLYPDREAAAHCGFLLAFELPSIESGVVEPLLTVHTADGEVGQRSLRVEIPPQEMDVGIVDPRNQTGTAVAGTGPLAMQLYIDNASVDRDGILHLEGWVVCLVQIESVDAFIGDVRIGMTEFGRARADVEKAHPDYPNSRFSGFILATDVSHLASGKKTLTIRAVARTGITGEATTEVTIPRRSAARGATPKIGFSYHCDEVTLTTAGRFYLKGWAVCAAATAEIVVFLDEEEIGRAELGLERPDVGNLFPAFPHARHPGFTLDAQVGQSRAGEHLITLRVSLGDGEVHEALLPVFVREANEPGAAAAEDSDHRLEIDNPPVIDGKVAAPIGGNLEISGWALARAGVAAIDIAIDGTPIALADYGLRRLDVRSAFPDRDDALASGYSALLPHRVLPKGRHLVSVTLRDRAGQTANTEFQIEVKERSDTSGPWSLRRKMAQAEIDLSLRILERRGRQPIFLVVLPVTDEAKSLGQAGATIASLCAQAYPNWRLLIAPQGTHAKSAAALLAAMGGLRERGDVLSDATLGALAELASLAGRPASETFLAVLAPGDELGVDAFLEMAIAAALYAEADFLYSDERCRNPASGTVDAFFKPQWSPDLMLATNYVGQLWCARADLLGAVADRTEKLLDGGEYDLVLRCTEAAKRVRHIPAVLCERGERAPDDIDSTEQAVAALGRALARRAISGEVGPGLVAGTHRLKRALERPGLVSIIIPTCAAQGLIETCITTLRRLTTYPDYEIICIENIPPKDRKWRAWLRRNADRVISTNEPFNWSRFNNLAAAQAKGRFLLFLNDDIEITDPDWLGTLLAEAQRPEIGVVGPRLLYPDRRIQHAGMFLAAMGQARHAFRYAAEDDPGYFGLALTPRNVIAVTGACLLTRRETFDALGGFDEAQAIINNDLDFCLRAWRSGLFNLYTPHATLIHHEAVSRSALADEYDVAAFDSQWRDLFLAGDPFSNPHLSKSHDNLVAEPEPTQLLVTGRPILSRDEIRNILVVKLDHIGDCVIAFPAVRRLKRHFPQARIAVLTSRASRPIWSLEPSVDETIEFDFFHARSALGELGRSEEDWLALRERLAPQRFDLAVDLRKHTETRMALQYSGARHLAGFDFRNQFPWLDITLEWAGDQVYARKHQHNGDDLINLVDAIAAACESDRIVIMPHPSSAPPPVPSTRRRSPEGPLVCVHPTVGNDARQWPPEYFVAVINRLIEEDGARVVLIGGPGDEPVAADIIKQVRRPKAISSVVGKVPLAELPALLMQAALFLGNNSGPKHIAAGLGVPTVGIHSGTEDVREWGPVGPSAIAVARDMVCAPCYLPNAADCRRGLACLRGLAPAEVYSACKRLLLLAAPASARAALSK